MSNKKQTAVEWLVEEIYKWENGESIMPATEIVTKAKELEKQQIIEAYSEGMGHYGDANSSSCAEKYYKKNLTNKI